jgi:hypothetical protein
MLGLHGLPRSRLSFLFLEYQMNSKPTYGVIILLLAAFVFAGCRKTESVETKPVEPVYFPAADVCNYPQGGPGKVFINLGGGTWGASDPTVPEAMFECVGSKGSVQLFKDDSSAIEVEYVATGVEKGSSLISLTYTASGSGPIPNESTNRNVFANLVDAVSRQGLGASPPELFKKKLSNLASYSQPGKGFTENFDIGKGFVLLTRESSGPSDIRVYVKFFPDVVLKLEG